MKYIGNPDPALCNGQEYTFGYDAFSDTDPFAVQLSEGLDAIAEDLGCVTFKKLVDNADPATAVQNARIFVQQDVDGAILFNVIEAAAVGQAQVLEQADIPVVSLAVPSPGQVFVTNDDVGDGRRAGDALAEAFETQGREGTPYLLLGRFDAQTSTQERADGTIEAIEAKMPGVEILEFETKADPPTAQAAAAAAISQIPEGSTILVSAINDDTTNAIFQAVKQAGRDGDAIVVAQGAVNPVGLNLMCRESAYYGGVGYFPENWPKFVVPAMMLRAQGVDVEDKILVKTEFIKTTDIARFYPDFNCEA